MLPWIFAVLLVLNLALFVWGSLGTPSAEPPLAPVPEGRHEIRLLGEVRDGAEGERGEGAVTVSPVPAVPAPAADGSPMRHSETALGRATVPGVPSVGEDTPAAAPLPTVRLQPDSPAGAGSGPGRGAADLPGTPAPTAPAAGAPGVGAPSPSSRPAPSPSPDRSDAEPRLRLPLPDPEPKVPGDESAAREAAV